MLKRKNNRIFVLRDKFIEFENMDKIETFDGFNKLICTCELGYGSNLECVVYHSKHKYNRIVFAEASTGRTLFSVQYKKKHDNKRAINELFDIYIKGMIYNGIMNSKKRDPNFWCEMLNNIVEERIKLGEIKLCPSWEIIENAE